MAIHLKPPFLSLLLLRSDSNPQFLIRHFSSWSLAIREASSTSPIKALNLYSQMHRRSLPFDSFSILFALKSSTHLPHSIAVTRHLHGQLLKLGFAAHVYVATSLLSAYTLTVFADACNLFDEMPVRNAVTWNVMITAYSRLGDVTSARRAFDTMPSRNLASWSAMITACMDNRCWEEGFCLFRGMGMCPDQLILGSILSGCGRMGSCGLVFGKSIHGFVVKNKWEMNMQLGACLVDMYAKCGVLNNALLVFDTIRGESVVALTALISGAAKNGYGREALQMFEMMRASGRGIEPNEVTMTAILTACVQEGFVEEGRSYFKMMDREWGLKPNIQHYGCMVDLFGKAGLVGEAYEVINSMPYEANIVIWGSFLSSCKLHKQLEMAEKVIDKVMRVVRPENDGGVYSLICDVYVLSGKWSEAARIREMMLKQHVRKVRGSSFV